MKYIIFFTKHFINPIAFVFFLSSCGTIIKQEGAFFKKLYAKRSNVEEQQTWEEIERQKTPNLIKRIKQIDRFIKNNKDKEVALKAYLFKARIYERNQKPKQACKSYFDVVNSLIFYEDQWKAYKALAQCYFREDRVELALETLEILIKNPKEILKNKKKFAQLQWEYLKKKPDWIKWKILVLSHRALLSLDRTEQQKLHKEGRKFISKLTDKELKFFAEQSSSEQSSSFGIFAGELLYKMGEYLWDNQQKSKAKKYYKKALFSSLPQRYKKQIRKKLEKIKALSKVNPYLIGVLVPLSGRRKALGEKILRGLHLGLDMDKDSPWQLMIMDSKSHPDVTQNRLDALFFKHNVIGVVGGLTSETAEVIASKATTFGVPAIVFSQKTGLALNREYVFQNSITAKDLLRPLAKTARQKLKIKKIALLYPEDSYGKEYATLFSKIFKQEGGKIVGQETYKIGEVDFKTPLKNLLHLNIKGRKREFEALKAKFLKQNPLSSARSIKLTPENLLPTKQEFEALFIPDTLDRIQIIKDHLKYFAVKKSYLLGTDLWRKNQISSWPKNFPLIFVNLPEKHKTFSGKESFYTEFKDFFQKSPGLFEQRAYNSGRILKQALSRGVKTHKALRAELHKIKKLNGAYYSVEITNQGVFKYPLSIYKSQSGQLIVLDSVPVK